MPAGAEKYCEYPANFLRIVNQFLLGIDLRRDGSVVLAPTVTDEFWDRGFGHVLRRQGALITYRLQRHQIDITYEGLAEQRLGVRFPDSSENRPWKFVDPATTCTMREEDGLLWITLPPAPAASPGQIEVVRRAAQ